MFGMIGDTFVVGSDERMARESAELEGEALDEPAASAIRVPARFLFTGTEGGDISDDERAIYDLLGDIRISASADRSALRAKGRIDFGEEEHRTSRATPYGEYCGTFVQAAWLAGSSS